MSQTILAVDPGTHSIKLTFAERSFGDFQITAFHEIPISDHELISHEHLVSVLLTRFFEENPIHFDTAITSISGLHISERLLEFPFSQLKKIDSAIEFELESYVPVPIEDLWFDYNVVDQIENFSKVLAVYTPKSEFVRFLNTLSQAKIDPRFVGAEALDLANLYHSGLLPPEGTYAILDLGHSKTNLCLMEGSRLKMARTLGLGGKAISQEIAKAFQIALDQADEMKIRSGQVSAFESGDRLAEVIQKVLDELLVQVKQTFFSYYEKGGKAVEAIYLCGGTSRLQGIDQYISTRLRINVAPLDLLDSSYAAKIEDIETIRPVVGASLAQIFRSVYPAKSIGLNFRRGEFAYKQDIQAISKNIWPWAKMAGVVTTLALVYFFTSLQVLGNREERLNKNVTEVLKGVPDLPKKNMASASSAIKIIDGKISDLNDQLKNFQQNSVPSALEVLRILSSSLPTRDELKVDVNDINISGVNQLMHIAISAKTDSYESIDKIEAAIKNIPKVQAVQRGKDAGKGSQGEVKFSISFDIGA